MEIKKIKPLIYVAGPYSNGGHSVKKNVEIANKYAHELRKLGFAVVCPHANTTYSLNHEIDWESWLEEDYSIILRCDSIFMLPNWKDSKGAVIEEKWAKELGIPIFYWDDFVDKNSFSNLEPLKNGDHIETFQFANIKEKFFGSTSVYQRCPNQVHEFLKLINNMFRVHVKKNEDYSKYNILGTGMVGLATRIWDKVSRLLSLSGFDIGTGEYSQPKTPKNESVDDTLLDLTVYSIIAQIYKKNKWGN